jgi:hypothetical protein
MKYGKDQVKLNCLFLNPLRVAVLSAFPSGVRDLVGKVVYIPVPALISSCICEGKVVPVLN